MEKLNARDQMVYDFIVKYAKDNGHNPTVREICAGTGLKSTSTVQTCMEHIKSAGYISSERGKHYYEIMTDEQPELHEDVAQIPIVGRVAAGQPILAEQNIEGYFPIQAGMLGRKDTFMLSVHGNSMIEAGILNGDYIMVERQETAENGDIVVAMVDGMFDEEATVKAFYKENGHIRLQPRNCEMEPIIVSDCKIVGKVKGVFRYLN